MDTVISLLMDWHLAIVLLVLLFLFPLIFYLSSMDRNPVRIKRVQVQKKKPARSNERRPVDDRSRRSFREEREHGNRSRVDEHSRTDDKKIERGAGAPYEGGSDDSRN